MDALEKIAEIRSLISQQPEPDAFLDQENKLKTIEARYAFSSSLMNLKISADPDVIQELIDIKASICPFSDSEAPPVLPPQSQEESNINALKENTLEKALLKDLIKKTVQGLSRLPTPLPSNFDKTSYNTFVTGKSRDILKLLQEDAYSINELNNIIKELDDKRLEFLSEPTKTVYNNALALLSQSPKDSNDSRIIDTFINKIKALEITSEELEYILDKYAIPDNEPATLEEKDITILLYVCEAPTILANVAALMGLSVDECDVLIRNLELDKKKKENLTRLTRRIILPPKYSGVLD